MPLNELESSMPFAFLLTRSCSWRLNECHQTLPRPKIGQNNPSLCLVAARWGFAGVEMTPTEGGGNMLEGSGPAGFRRSGLVGSRRWSGRR